MGWLTTLSDLHVQLKTFLERVDKLQTQATKTQDDVRTLAVNLAEVRGFVASSPTSELLRQLDELKRHNTDLEVRLRSLEFLIKAPAIDITHPKLGENAQAITRRTE